MTETKTLEPVAVRSDEGEARWWFGSLAVIKATGADTGGQFTIVEITEPPGAEAPLHVHHREDEAFWILEGNVTLEVGGRRSRRARATTRSARAGSRTATRSAPPAAGCSSSAHPPASRPWCAR